MNFGEWESRTYDSIDAEDGPTLTTMVRPVEDPSPAGRVAGGPHGSYL